MGGQLQSELYLNAHSRWSWGERESRGPKELSEAMRDHGCRLGTTRATRARVGIGFSLALGLFASHDSSSQMNRTGEGALFVRLESVGGAHRRTAL